MAVVTSVERVVVDEEVFDFTVDEDHNYFAGHGAPILVHNCHQANAAAFSRVLNRINVRRKLGLTATVHRKDCCHPDSIVMTPKGAKKLSNVRVGDRVLCYGSDEMPQYREVLLKHERKVGPMLEICYEGGSVRLTPDHRLWSVTRRTYVAARDVSVGEELLPYRPFAKVSK